MEPQWHCFVDILEVVKLFSAGKLEQKQIEKDYHPSNVLREYTISDQRLKQFVLLLATYINAIMILPDHYLGAIVHQITIIILPDHYVGAIVHQIAIIT